MQPVFLDQWRGPRVTKTRCLQGATELGMTTHLELQALVYDILPSTIAVFSYAIGSRKLSANQELSCWCSNSSKFVTNKSNYVRRLFQN